MIHPSTKFIEPVPFVVAHNEGSVLMSCTTSLAIGLIKPHASLDQLPPGSNIISSSADQPRNDKSQLNVHLLMGKSKTSKLIRGTKKISDMCSKKEQHQLISKSKEYQVHQCVEVPVHDETGKWECQANVKKGDKNCQETPNSHMQPVMPAKESSHMQSVRRPEMLQSSNKQNIYDKCPVKSMFSDKNCQDTKFMCQ